MKTEQALKVIFLGGVGEIGKNMTAFEYQDDIIILDCGLAFPDDRQPGVDFVIPSMQYLEQNKERVRGVILTHGHEDHIGAVPYLLRNLPKVPVYGTALTLGLASKKMDEEQLEKIDFVPISNRCCVKLGKFRCEFVHVSHSVAGSVAVSLSTPVGTVFHTGDFKVDYNPLGGEVMDLNRIAEIGKAGVQLLMSESTNVEKEGYTMSESVVASAIDKIFQENSDRRIIIATFASNVDRLQTIFEISQKYKRRVAISGRSMITNIEIAKKVGAISYDEKQMVELDKIGSVKDGNLVVLSTGTQGEPMSALTRMASGGFNKIKIGNNDTIVISGSPIPGNEKDVYQVINNLYRLGARVIYDKIAAIHSSGHACQEELKLIHTLIKPKFFIPVHGEYRHLKQHSELAQSLGMSPQNVVIPDIGDIISVTKNKIAKSGTAPSGNVLVDGYGIGDVGSIVLKDRMELSEEGLLIVLVRRGKEGSFLEPEIISRGFIYMGDENNAELIKDLKAVVVSSLKKLGPNELSIGQAKGSIIKAVRSYLSKRIRRRPVILPIIVEA